MSVPFEQAIEELYSIFGGFDKEIIETVLRQNKGHMEKTIDALLEMNGEQPINENTDQDQNIAQIHQDEMLARMMQNQLFLNEIRNDQDFSGLFNNPNNGVSRNGDNSNNSNSGTSSIGGNVTNRHLTPKEELEQYQQKQQLYNGVDEPSALSIFEEDFQEIKVKFNQLGEVAKNKFRELTEMFNKKEETKYESVRTGDEINSGDDNNNYNNNNEEENEEDDDDEEEVVVYDRYNNRNRNSGGGFSNTRHINTGINTNYSLNDDEGEEEYDSFILESDRSRNTSTSRMRTTVNSYSNHKKQD